MTEIKKSINARLTVFTGIIAFLFVLFFILQYNNFILTKKTISQHDYINQTKIIPGEIQIYHFKFIKNEIYNEQLYTNEKSSSLDSIEHILKNYSYVLDSIQNTPYLHLTKASRILESLRSDCKSLSEKYISLRRLILDRGLFSTGQSGEWHRYANYLTDLANSFNSPAVMRGIAALNRQVNEYDLNRTSEKMLQLLEYINTLKVQLTGNSISLPEASKLKYIKELDSFYALTVSLQKTDTKIGLINGEGFIGETALQLAILHDKSGLAYNEMKSSINNSLLMSFLFKVIFIAILAFIFVYVIYYYSRKLSRSVNQIKNFSSALTLGKLPHQLKLSMDSEFSDISDNLNSFVTSLREKIKFASRLESGQTDVALCPLSEDDVLANALLDVEKSLKKAAEEDLKYKSAEQKRAWANEGIARFGEVLRMQTDNLSTLSDEIIKNLVKYINANQGMVFLYNDDDRDDIHLELISAFAFDRKKFLKKRIEIGEGLVGTCAQEKQTIFITDIPEDYVEITSGLGEATPRCILILPLMTENNIFGILEVASLNIFQPFEIEFMERIAQNIASTFATVKINIHTNRLLEQSKRQAEEMAQQEEEMRQNLEELQATQEESARREAEINSLINAVDTSSLVVHVDMDGRISDLNKKLSGILKMSRDEIIGRYLKNIFKFNSQIDEFTNLMTELKKGNHIKRNEEVNVNGSSVFLEMHYSSISGPDGKPYKIIGIATDVTDYKKLEETLSQKEDKINHLNFSFKNYREFIREGFIVCELSVDGTITDVNENYAEITGYHVQEVTGKDYRKFLKPDELKQFETIWTEVLKDKTYKGVIKRTKPTGEENWLMSSFVPLKDLQNNIQTIYLLAQDITEKKLKYQVLEDANKEIERLKSLQKNQE